MSDTVSSQTVIAESALGGVLWDMDGTLLESEKLWEIALSDLSVRLGGQMTEATRVAVIGASAPFALATVFDALGLDQHPEAVAEAKDWMYARVGELFEDGVRWRPGAQEALATVREAGLRSALVTNTERSLVDRAMVMLGPEFFDQSVCGDEVAFGKPAADPYLRGAHLLGLEPSQCLAVEDSPTGTESARAAGCAVLVVPCEVDVPAGPGRIFRKSLVGLSVHDLRDVHASAAR
ncbi:HAD superfamily hydrolase (TIGR01509 family) [Rhodococcus sp. 27YEA15]|uniref:HAD family hydrolase n=1 Tax=Rhodococcus sp. 27YEA15 TaxID=3156259 RepID=UPI003C7BB739